MILLYAYDAEGTRVTKSGSSGEVTYVDPAYVIRNNSITGKHVFVGNTRVASKMDVKGDDEMSGVYYYHADHLGSSSVVTGKKGGFHERIEYFPYGETWVEDKATSDGYSSPYRYTAKEYDPETGLYYFGARYYDARLSRWVSTDPALEEYLPNSTLFRATDEKIKKMYYEIFSVSEPTETQIGSFRNIYYMVNHAYEEYKELKGNGGIFNSLTNNLYHYAENNPIRFIDIMGLWTYASEYGTTGEGLTQNITQIENDVDNAQLEINGREGIVTFTTNGTHSTNSLHYSGNAVDLRVRDMTTEQRQELTNNLREALGDDYDVVDEIDHIHIEYDPD